MLSVPIQLGIPGSSRFTFLENVDYESSHDDAMQAYHAIERRTGFKFRTWRDDEDRVLFADDLAGTQPMLPISDTAYHRPSGTVAAAGFGRTEFHDDPSLHELKEYLWVRPSGEARFVRIAVEGDPWAIDIAPDGSFVVGLSWLGGGIGALCTVVDTRTCCPRELTVLKLPNGADLTGGEELRVSPDSNWLLLVTSGDQESVILVEVETGRIVALPFPGLRTASWWPQRSPSSLLVGWIDSNRQTTLGAFDLATGDRSDLGVLKLPAGVRDDDAYTFGVERVTVGPDGTSLLGLTHIATDPAWSMPRKPRRRIVQGELLAHPQDGIAGLISEVPEAFLDANGAAAVDHSRPHWIDVEIGAPVEIATSLVAESAYGPVAAG